MYMLYVNYVHVCVICVFFCDWLSHQTVEWNFAPNLNRLLSEWLAHLTTILWMIMCVCVCVQSHFVINLVRHAPCDVKHKGDDLLCF